MLSPTSANQNLAKLPRCAVSDKEGQGQAIHAYVLSTSYPAGL